MTQESKDGTTIETRARRRQSLPIGGALAAGTLVALVIWRSGLEGPRTPARVVPAATGSAGTAPPTSSPPTLNALLDYDAIRNAAQLTLRASLKEPSPAVRAQGSDALGMIQDSPSVPALAELAEHDPDDAVRGRAADALSTLGVAMAPQLARLVAAAQPALKVSYASALARLGDPEAPGRLLEYTRSPDLAVSFKAGLALADSSRPGDANALAVLKALAAREVELDDIAPHARALILTKLAALRDTNAHKVLYALLEDEDERTRLAAAEGLARLGDDAGKQVLLEVLADRTSPHWLVAVLALIPLNEYGDLGMVTAKLDDKDPETRRLAARALGEIGDHRSLPALLVHANEQDWTVRVAAAAAIVSIVGLDPWLLAQTSVDWATGALVSQDPAERKAAASVLADLPEQAALRLLARAIEDPDPDVRRVGAESAGKMKSADAAAALAVAAKTERDPAVKEQQVKALGELGSPAVRDTLAQISEEPGRIGVLAAGSLIAIGDLTGMAKLEAAIASPQVELRLAAVQAASASKNPLVIPTLKIGVVDRVFDIRFTAAEGLSFFRAEEALAVPVLTEALESEDAGVVGRALAALIRFGKQLIAKMQPPADMLDSTESTRRLATVSVVRVLPPDEGVPLLRRLVADPDRDVRRAGVEAIASITTTAPGQAIGLYKPLVHDADPVVRAKASGQLSRLLPAVRPPPDPLLQVRVALDEATAEAKAAAATFEALTSKIAMKLAEPALDEVAIMQVQALATKLDEATVKLAAAATKAELAAQTASDAAGASPSPEVAKLVVEAKVLAQRTLDGATRARGKRANLQEKTRNLTVDVEMLIDGAAASIATAFNEYERRVLIPMLIDDAAVSIATGDLPEAEQQLDRAAKLLGTSRAKNPGLEYAYAQLYDKMSAQTQDPLAKLALLQQAKDAYLQFARIGTGSQIEFANARAAELADELNVRAAELADELKQLGQL